ncbi:MAG: plasmid pRiA4b ORF-3 family protein, partial [Bacteroidales bacterium]|nr:plasmid pRiA4b ORF-3 family protein [Bacteroidales bacterium]
MTKSNIIPFPGSRQPGTKQSDTGSIYRLRVELEEIEPVIYRVLLVRGTIGLDLLHAILQVAIGWTNSHLHKFNIGDSEYSDPEFNLNEDAFEGQKLVEDEAIVNLDEVAPRKGFPFSYEYDFGDSWEHRITVEDILPDDGTLAGFAECIDGKRACPPEDCGGVPGYADFVETITDPENEEYESMLEWVGGAFDPEAFDIKKVNRFLKKIKWENPTVEQLAKVL